MSVREVQKNSQLTCSQDLRGDHRRPRQSHCHNQSLMAGHFSPLPACPRQTAPTPRGRQGPMDQTGQTTWSRFPWYLPGDLRRSGSPGSASSCRRGSHRDRRGRRWRVSRTWPYPSPRKSRLWAPKSLSWAKAMFVRREVRQYAQQRAAASGRAWDGRAQDSKASLGPGSRAWAHRSHRGSRPIVPVRAAPSPPSRQRAWQHAPPCSSSCPKTRGC